MSRVRSALIVGSAPVFGGFEHYARCIRDADILIAADGGTLLCLDAGRAPDICVGDFDSTAPEVLDRAAALGSQVMRHPREKNESDLDLALDVARSLEVCAVTLTAAFSGRVDHTLAALGTLVAAADLQGCADEPEWRAYGMCSARRPQLELAADPGAVISLIAVGGPARVDIDGVRYPLVHGQLPTLSSLGLSNVAVAVLQSVHIESGTVVVIVNTTNGPTPLQ